MSGLTWYNLATDACALFTVGRFGGPRAPHHSSPASGPSSNNFRGRGVSPRNSGPRGPSSRGMGPRGPSSAGPRAPFEDFGPRGGASNYRPRGGPPADGGKWGASSSTWNGPGSPPSRWGGSDDRWDGPQDRWNGPPGRWDGPPEGFDGPPDGWNGPRSPRRGRAKNTGSSGGGSSRYGGRAPPSLMEIDVSTPAILHCCHVSPLSNNELITCARGWGEFLYFRWH